jgi:CRP-like cAMP-binding protein
MDSKDMVPAFVKRVCPANQGTLWDLESVLFTVASLIFYGQNIAHQEEKMEYRELLPFTHEELSFLVGVHRVSITRAMKELRRAGRIIQDKKKITLIGELN